MTGTSRRLLNRRKLRPRLLSRLSSRHLVRDAFCGPINSYCNNDIRHSLVIAHYPCQTMSPASSDRMALKEGRRSETKPGSTKTGSKQEAGSSKTSRRSSLTQHACSNCRQKKSKVDSLIPMVGGRILTYSRSSSAMESVPSALVVERAIYNVCILSHVKASPECKTFSCSLTTRQKTTTS